MDFGHEQQLQAMMEHFDRQRIVEVQVGILGDPDFPPVMQVEDRGGDDLSHEERGRTALVDGYLKQAGYFCPTTKKVKSALTD